MADMIIAELKKKIHDIVYMVSVQSEQEQVMAIEDLIEEARQEWIRGIRIIK